MEPLRLLFEAPQPNRIALPAPLAQLYGGELGFPNDCLFANFVSTLDGVVAIPSIPQSNKLISQGSEGDRFVMGLLRACADAVVIGSGTFHGSPGGRWTAESAYPPLSEAFAELRRTRGRPPRPELVVLTASGEIDLTHPALDRGALILTTGKGDDRIRGGLPDGSSSISLGDAELDLQRATDLLRGRGHSLILSEGGPHVFGAMLAAGLIDQLFLTLSPALAGRREPQDRLQLIEGAALMPDVPLSGELLSVRSDDEHLLLRYALTGPETTQLRSQRAP